jgi:hypothetical protein
MPTLLAAAEDSAQRDNDYFTSTIVGLPSEVALGRAYTKRKLNQHPTLSVDAITASVWHSDGARALLKQHVKQSPKTLGLPFPADGFARQRTYWSELLAFLLGFGICAAGCFAYFNAYPSLPWLQKLFGF